MMRERGRSWIEVFRDELCLHVEWIGPNGRTDYCLITLGFFRDKYPSRVCSGSERMPLIGEPVMFDVGEIW